MLTQDQASALQITMKAIEARACGVARYFPFVFPFYVEGANNFGMMGQEGTPLRSMAAYTEAIVQLSGAVYVGDLQGSPIKARIFSRGTSGYGIVFFSGQVTAGATFLPGQTLTVSGAYGIDGRPLTVGGDGSIPIPDGLTYVTLPAGSLPSVRHQYRHHRPEPHHAGAADAAGARHALSSRPAIPPPQQRHGEQGRLPDHGGPDGELPPGHLRDQSLHE
ncbi:MAG: hypothetical protein WDN28_05570 [Chthoniobacter sp.]